MWDKFTERSRVAIAAAIAKATSHGQAYVGVEHLLWGLVADDSPINVAVRIVRRLGIAPAQIHQALDERVRWPARSTAPEAGPEPRLTPRSKLVLDDAMAVVDQDGGGYVGTEHILLGLAGENGGPTRDVLSNLGASPEAIDAEITALIQAG